MILTLTHLTIGEIGIIDIRFTEYLIPNITSKNNYEVITFSVLEIIY